MKSKRFVCLLLSVVLAVFCLPMQASAAAAAAVVPDGILLYPFSSNPYISLTYDFILTRTSSYDAKTDSYLCPIYFCKSSEVTKSADGKWNSTGNVPYVSVYIPSMDSASDPKHLMSKFFPEALAYSTASHITPPYYTAKIVDLVAYRVDGVRIVAEAPPPPPPPDPPPDPPPVIPDPPPIVIPPVDMWFVPWNTDRMVDFDTYIRRVAGATVNVAFVGFGLILAIYVMIRIIRIFERTSGGGGE